MYKHFIITRFNLKIEGLSIQDKNKKTVRTEQWLQQRFILFEKYCLPSIMNQSKKDFIWFVLFDVETPQFYLDKIKEYELQFPLFKPIFLLSGDYDTVKTMFNNEIIKYIDENDKYIITSRVDNDDALHIDYIKNIQKKYKPQHNIFISFTYGLQYDINKKVLALMYYKNNHFVSRIEKITDSINTVITHDHTYIDKAGSVVYLNNRSKPMWLEIIHDDNIINNLYPTSIPLFFKKVGKCFYINDILNISISNTIVSFTKYIRINTLIKLHRFLKSHNKP